MQDMLLYELMDDIADDLFISFVQGVQCSIYCTRYA